jgi:diguanylate cyclase (GGDEF)-like protein
MTPALATERLLAIIETQNQIATAALDLDAVMELVVERAQHLTGAAAAVVELAEGEEMVYHVGRGAADEHLGLRLPIDSSISGLCVRQATTLHCVDAATDDRVNLDACRRVGAISMVCVPLTHVARVVGVLKVYDPRAHAFSADDVATLDLLSGVIAAHMAHASDFEAHHHDSRHDGLTGLPNRRALDERLATEIARAKRHGGGLTVCVLDLDRFKQVNDTQGHAAGDQVLRAVAGKLAQLRDEDAAYRLGGDEFALVLIEGAGSAAQPVIERISSAIAADPACHGVRASWGVADFEADDDVHVILARADAKLYAAKRTVAR